MAFNFSVMLDVEEKNALVVGGGAVALRKVRKLLEAKARVSLIALDVCKELITLGEEGALQCYEEAFTFARLEQLAPFIVFAATDDDALNQAIARYCQTQNLLVNVATSPQDGNLSLQAEMRKEHFTVSLSTYGQGPGFARELRDFLARQLDARFDEAVRLYIDVRQWLLATVAEKDRRRALMARLHLGDLCALLETENDDYEESLERVKTWLSCSSD